MQNLPFNNLIRNSRYDTEKVIYMYESVSYDGIYRDNQH